MGKTWHYAYFNDDGKPIQNYNFPINYISLIKIKKKCAKKSNNNKHRLDTNQIEIL